MIVCPNYKLAISNKVLSPFPFGIAPLVGMFISIPIMIVIIVFLTLSDLVSVVLSIAPMLICAVLFVSCCSHDNYIFKKSIKYIDNNIIVATVYEPYERYNRHRRRHPADFSNTDINSVIKYFDSKEYIRKTYHNCCLLKQGRNYTLYDSDDGKVKIYDCYSSSTNNPKVYKHRHSIILYSLLAYLGVCTLSSIFYTKYIKNPTDVFNETEYFSIFRNRYDGIVPDSWEVRSNDNKISYIRMYNNEETGYTNEESYMWFEYNIKTSQVDKFDVCIFYDSTNTKYIEEDIRFIISALDLNISEEDLQEYLEGVTNIINGGRITDNCTRLKTDRGIKFGVNTSKDSGYGTQVNIYVR